MARRPPYVRYLYTYHVWFIDNISYRLTHCIRKPARQSDVTAEIIESFEWLLLIRFLFFLPVTSVCLKGFYLLYLFEIQSVYIFVPTWIVNGYRFVQPSIDNTFCFPNNICLYLWILYIFFVILLRPVYVVRGNINICYYPDDFYCCC